jgi:hypothetical protein
MKTLTASGLLFLTVVGASCGGRQAVEINSSAQPTAARWNGTLATPPGLGGVVDIHGAGWMGPDEKDAGRTEAQVDISNAVPGGENPWHVHRGHCGADQGIFGSADAYKPLKVDGNGRASSTAELAIPTPKTGEFFVNVHASAKNMSTIVACGNLAPPSR